MIDTPRQPGWAHVRTEPRARGGDRRTPVPRRPAKEGGTPACRLGSRPPDRRRQRPANASKAAPVPSSLPSFLWLSVRLAEQTGRSRTAVRVTVGVSSTAARHYASAKRCVLKILRVRLAAARGGFLRTNPGDSIRGRTKASRRKYLGRLHGRKSFRRNPLSALAPARPSASVTESLFYGSPSSLQKPGALHRPRNFSPWGLRQTEKAGIHEAKPTLRHGPAAAIGSLPSVSLSVTTLSQSLHRLPLALKQ